MDESFFENAQTVSDYMQCIINSFKAEYNKIKLPGILYDISLGEDPEERQQIGITNYDAYYSKIKALDRLIEAGLIIKYEIDERSMEGGYYIWNYAVCKINEKILETNENIPNETKVTRKTLSDYTSEAIEYLKNEYNKNRLKNISYEYILGVNKEYYLNSEGTNTEVAHLRAQETEDRIKAIQNLYISGIITEYELDQKTIENETYVDFIICKIDEKMLLGEKEPYINQERLEEVKEKIVRHEHLHRFENSIQEKDIQITVKNDDDLDNPSLILFRTSNEEKKYYFHINNNKSFKTRKAEYHILKYFEDNKMQVRKEKLLKECSTEDAFQKRKSRINKDLEKEGLILDSIKNNEGTSYRIRKI